MNNRNVHITHFVVFSTEPIIVCTRICLAVFGILLPMHTLQSQMLYPTTLVFPFVF